MRLSWIMVALVLGAACGGDADTDDDDDDDGGEPSLEVVDGDAGLGVTAIEFGSAAFGGESTFTIRLASTGDAAVTVTSIAVSGSNASDFAVDASCLGAIAPGTSCALDLTFSPTATGARTASLDIGFEAGGARTVSIALNGEGVAPPDTDGIAITFAGGALGEVRVSRASDETVLSTCTATCLVPVEPGTAVVLEAVTPSELDGFTGDCTSSTDRCAFTLASDMAAVTVTFTPDEKEGWGRFLPGGAIFTAAFDPQGNLVIGQSGAVTKLSTTGTTVWTLAMSVTSLAVDREGSIFVVSGTDLVEVSPAGAVVATRALPVEARGCPTYASTTTGFRHCVATGSDNSVAVHGTTGAARWAADGTQTWAKTVTSEGLYGITIDGNGVVLIAALSPISFEETDAVRFTGAGAALATLEGVTAQYDSMFATTAAGLLVATSAGHSHVDLDAPGFSRSVDLPAIAGNTPNGVAATGTGDLGWVYEPQDESGPPKVWTAKRFTSTGTLSWELTSTVVHADLEDYGTRALDIAGDDDGTLALVGTFDGLTFHGGWVQTFTP